MHSSASLERARVETDEPSRFKGVSRAVRDPSTDDDQDPDMH